MQKLNNIEQITELANELGRKVAKNDVNEHFSNVVWVADKQGRTQTLRIGDNFYRSDVAEFYPNGIKPESNGKKLTEPRKVNDSEKLAKTLKNLNELCEKYNVKIGLAAQTFERIEKAIQAEREEAIVAAEIAKTAQKEAIMAKIAALQAQAAAL
jgi:hypothetical protein